DLALADGDFRLARGHYGYAYQLGIQALEKSSEFTASGASQRLPYAIAANQPFYQAGRGVVECLLKMGKRNLAQDVINRLLTLDSRDPLAIRRLLAQSPPQSDRKQGRSKQHRKKRR
ncbi:MAG TPA: hypothetical protein VGI75_04615, partial [Pirellulales bacterium]